jgi:DNA invertase Pin-like site-specific DNA recombinase/prefoldin subunit 5
MARKSRGNIQATTIRQRVRVWLIAIYIRLSREDARSNDESESVSNQRAIIEKHIANFNDGDDYVIVNEYVDDGISGTTDEERDSFQDMLRDIQSGRVNCVIVKDLARSFRNYSDQGYYLDDWFPRHNVRFISMFHQPLDSYKDPRNMRSIAVPIQGVMNENHCAETSDKVRQVFDMKRGNGEHIGSFAPFGYLKHPDDKNALIVDETAAAVVKDIFKMFLDGMSKNAIVHTLNDHGVHCPAAYKREVLKLKYTNPSLDPAKKPLWTATSVTSVLKNRMYCGDMVQGRYRMISYKVHIQEKVPEEDWIIIENTHEAIIERPVFDKVQELLKRDTRTGPQQNKLYLFSGFLRCADCGKAMARSEVRGFVYYFCRTYKDQSKTACTKHSIKHDRLEAAVLYAVQRQVYNTIHYANTIASINKAPLVKSQSDKIQAAISQKEKELAKVTRYKQAVWQDWKDGEISHMDYRHLREDYETQAQELMQVIETLRAEQAGLEKGINAENPVLVTFRQFENIDKLTREVLIELVEQIKVYDNGNISVKFKFSDEIRRICEYIDMNTQLVAV